MPIPNILILTAKILQFKHIGQKWKYNNLYIGSIQKYNHKMKRRTFLKNSAVAAGSVMAAGNLSASEAQPASKNIYELKVYQFSGGAGVNQIKNYYTKAVIPFLNKRGATVGAFGEYSKEEPPRIYILHAHKSPTAYWNAVQEMKTDAAFIDAAKPYHNLPASQPVFERYETLLLEAFKSIPQLRTPSKDRGLFELRIYESHNEDAFKRKVKMFDDEELPLFDKVGLHPVFFGELLAGKYMPALVYMLWFKDMKEREANWDKFRTSNEWEVMRNKEIYANTVSKVRKLFLEPLDFSQI